MNNPKIFVPLLVLIMGSMGIFFWFFDDLQGAPPQGAALVEAGRTRAVAQTNPTLSEVASNGLEAAPASMAPTPAPTPAVSSRGPGRGVLRRFSGARVRSPLAVLARWKSSKVWTAEFSPDGRQLATGGDRVVRLYETRNWQPSRSFEGSPRFAFSPDSRLLATEGAGVAIWRVSSAKRLQLLDDKTGVFSAVGAWGPMAFSPDGRRIATLGETPNTNFNPYDGGPITEAATIRQISLKTWDVGSGKRLSVAPGPEYGAGSSAAVAWVAVRTAKNKTPTASYLSAGTQITSLQGHTLLLRTYDRRYFSVYDYTARQLLCQIARPTQIGAAAIAPGGALVAGGSAVGNTVMIWRTFDQKLLAQARPPGDAITATAFSPDRKKLAVVSRQSFPDTGSVLTIYGL